MLVDFEGKVTYMIGDGGLENVRVLQEK